MGESAQLRFALKNFGRISSIAQPKNLLNWGNFAQIERKSPEIFGAKLNCAGSPISGEKNNYCEWCKIKFYTVIIFLARNGRTRAVIFRLKNFGRFSFDLGEISPIQQILRLSNGRNSPKLGEIRPKFLRANLNCANSPISKKFRPKKNYCVYNLELYSWVE
jgi:hypothetical protein